MKFPRSIVAVVAFLATAGIACTPAGNPNNTVQTDARAAVTAAETAWSVAAGACQAASETEGGVNVEAACAEYLLPAHDLIADAASAVDAMAEGGALSQGAICNLAAGVALVAKAATDPALKLPESAAVVIALASGAATGLKAGAACGGDAGAF
jgi:hypothetical protein